MLFPADGIEGIKKFFLDTMVEFGRRGMACQPAVVGLGIGGCKDTTMRIAKEAACLRPVGDANPDPQIAALEQELKQLGNSIGMGPMGYVGSSMVVDAHVEIAYTHTGGMPVAIHTFCFASRRATAHITPEGEVRVESPESRVESPESRVESPESRAFSMINSSSDVPVPNLNIREH